MSAFLAFSNKRRAALKRQHPDATNADLSKMLSKTWKEASDDVRQKYMDEEAGLREQYKISMAAWRAKVAAEKKAERQEREAMAMKAAESNQGLPAILQQQQQQQQQAIKQEQQSNNPNGFYDNMNQFAAAPQQQYMGIPNPQFFQQLLAQQNRLLAGQQQNFFPQGMMDQQFLQQQPPQQQQQPDGQDFFRQQM